jgi:hypothetical protein
MALLAPRDARKFCDGVFFHNWEPVGGPRVWLSIHVAVISDSPNRQSEITATWIIQKSVGCRARKTLPNGGQLPAPTIGRVFPAAGVAQNKKINEFLSLC